MKFLTVNVFENGQPELKDINISNIIMMEATFMTVGNSGTKITFVGGTTIKTFEKPHQIKTLIENL